MLKFLFIRFDFFKFFQSGFYLDFFFKKIVEIFVKNFFLYSSIFFGEKFLIEYLTKKSVDSFIFRSNLFFNFFEILFSKFFVFFVLFIFFFWSLFILLFFF